MHRTFLGFFTALSLSCTPAIAQDAAPLDAATVQAFVDSRMDTLLKRSWTPGVVVSVVQGDRVIALSGVGTADANRKQPIDPDRTLFRVGSITKVMTSIAALRFVERGEMDLDTDVNHYLTAVRVPDTFAQPLTPRLLMSHHGGLDIVLSHLQVDSDEDARMTPEEVERTLVRVRAPDAPRIYDDLAFGLMGYVLSNIAHKPLSAVLDDEVFTPLGMTHATVGLPAARLADAAQCHELGTHGNTKICKQAILVDIAEGAGDVSVTGTDMAAFMTGLIQPGRVLPAARLAQMKSVDANRFHPLVLGLGTPLWESRAGNRVLYGHTGAIDGFLSLFAIFPGSDIGIFVSVNAGFGVAPDMSISDLISLQPPGPAAVRGRLGPKELIVQFLEEFATRFVPPNAPSQEALLQKTARMPGEEVDAAKLSGSYFRADQSRSLLVNLIAPLSGSSVTANEDGSLTIDGKGPYVRHARSYYRYTDPDGKHVDYAFKKDDAGRQLLTRNEPWQAPFGIWQRQPWYATAAWAVLPLLILMLLQTSALGRLRWEKDARRRRTLRIAGISGASFLVALLLELQFGDPLDHTGTAQLFTLLWRIVFPSACVGFVYNAYSTLRGIIARHGHPGRARVAEFYSDLLGVSGLGLVWLAAFWGIISLFWRVLH